ncbi:sensor histidine kinase [Brachybacterium sp. J153]|uniref:sensor histidine kinase n=1 Tax=Brachybacterium sp. J153 TaxID=3116488 RepID=UPI002E77CCB0|nr:histidine kinase [Brachybacterium sp. J153]MEE1619139.1 histidine kinase [Brachybacterium sp. J153]
MDDTSAAPPRSRPPRLTFTAVLGVLPASLLAWTWGVVSITLLLSGLGGLAALGAGVLLLVPWLLLMRVVVRLERRRVVAVHRMEVIVPQRRRSRRTGLGGWIHDAWLEISSGPYWRGVLHHHLSLLVAAVFAGLALVLAWTGWTATDIALRHGALELGSATLPRWGLGLIGGGSILLAILALVLGGLADRGLARGLISGNEEDLRGQVAELATRRQGAVDAAAQERLRIERDLHDGVQPRLVALAMTLGMARSAIRTDPDRATELVTEAHSEAKAVITDLRQLARGIHPAVLTDRGLDAALSALAARSVTPVDLEVQLHGSLDAEREAVAYFVVSEALTNIAKHAGAQRARVSVTQDPSTLRVRIEDDGRGGAQVRRDGVSTGLAGLTDRVRATGGRLEVTSPASGGTVLLAEIPTTPPSAAATAASASDRPRALPAAVRVADPAPVPAAVSAAVPAAVPAAAPAHTPAQEDPR